MTRTVTVQRHSSQRSPSSSRRVLPTPPGPVIVTSRCVSSRSATAASSVSRPSSDGPASIPRRNRAGHSPGSSAIEPASPPGRPTLTGSGFASRRPRTYPSSSGGAMSSTFQASIRSATPSDHRRWPPWRRVRRPTRSSAGSSRLPPPRGRPPGGLPDLRGSVRAARREPPRRRRRRGRACGPRRVSRPSPTGPSRASSTR